MKAPKATILAVIVPIACCPLLFGEYEATKNNDGFCSHDGNQAARIFASESRISMFSDLTQNREVAVFDESWTFATDAKIVDYEIEKSIKNGVPTLVVGEEDYMAKSSIHFEVDICVDDTLVYGFYFENGIEYQFNGCGSDLEWAIDAGKNWVESLDDAVLEFSSEGSIVDLGDVATAIPAELYILRVSRVTTSLGVRGEYSTVAFITKVTNSIDPDYDYYMIHYNQVAAPNDDSNCRVGDLELEAIISGGDLLYAEPTNTSGVSNSQITVSFSGSAGPEGPGVTGGLSYSWSYSIADVVVQNSSIMSINKANIWHNIDELRNVGKGYTAEPGILFFNEIDSGSVTVSTTSLINTYLWHSRLFWNYCDNSEVVRTYITYTINGTNVSQFVALPRGR